VIDHDTTCTEFDNVIKHSVKNHNLDVLKIKHLELNEKNGIYGKLNTEPSIGASHQVSVHLTKQFQRRRFLEINQPETRIAYSSHVC
jgi:hypothetical protein